MNSRLVFTTSLALLAVSCSNRYRQQAISPEAGAIFARGETTVPGGSLVLDFEAMRELGVIGSGTRAAENRSEIIDLAILMLSVAAAETPDESKAELLSRIAVLTAIMRDWSIWPEVQRLGVFVPMPNGPLDSRAAAEHSLVVLASKGGPAATREFLRGLAAMDRAMGKARFSSKGEFLCLKDGKLPAELCLRAGPRYLAIGTPKALEAIDKQHAPAQPASGPHLRVRIDVPGIGAGEALIEGQSSVRLAANIRPADPAVAAALVAAANKRLEKMDESFAKARALVGKDLERTKQALLADPEAPKGMKASASSMTVERMLNPRGEYDQVRKSIKVALRDGAFTAEMIVPESQVRRLTDGTSAMSSAAAMGIIAAVAVPAFARRAGAGSRSSTDFGEEGDAAGSVEAEIASLRAKAAREPTNAEAWAQLGNVYFDNGRPREAIEAYDRSLAIRPRDANVLTDQGVMYREVGEFQKAIAAFKKASRVDPKHVKCLHNLGVVYMNDLEQRDQAIAVWKQALAIARDGVEADQLREAIEQASKKR